MLLEASGDSRILRDDLHGAASDPHIPPPGARADWTVPQKWTLFTKDEHALWDHLFDRQVKLLRDRVVEPFWEGLDLLRLCKPGIPDFSELNVRLHRRTGWTVVAVPGLVPDSVFFEHLRNRRFPAGNFLRTPRQVDYLEEPDVFHDVFGHVPLLAHPDMARWTERLGEFAIDAEADGTMALLARLYWWTVEFGLAFEKGRLRIYGAGIASSLSESVYALESRMPLRQAFDMKDVLGTPFRSDTFQDLYFVVDGFSELVKRVETARWSDLVAGRAWP